MIEAKNIESICCAGSRNSGRSQNERRQHTRINAEKIGVDCDMSSASWVKVMNISSSGVLVMADKLINIGKSYALKIGYKDKQILVKANAVWALLADCIKEANGDVTPIYIAGMQFVNILKGEVKEIMQLLEVNSENTTPNAFQDMLQGNSYN